MSDQVVVLESRIGRMGLQPGIYVASSDSPAYGQLKALELLGEATYVGENFLEDGRTGIAVRVHGRRSATPNPSGQLELGDDHFTKEIDQYRHWQSAWWREAIQNSVDAGGRNISLESRYLDENRSPTTDMSQAKFCEVVCDDDGKGMTPEILVEKFVGKTRASGKRGEEGAAGGFGKAKDLLLFGWIEYTVHTNDTFLTGRGIRWSYEACSDLNMPSRRGTRLTVIMPVGKCSPVEFAQTVIDYSNLPRVRFTLNGVERRANLTPGRYLKDLTEDGAVAIHYQRQRQGFEQPSIIVRDKSGLFMYAVPPPYGFVGVVVVELRKPSIEILTANRDGMRDPWGRLLERFCSEIASDATAALSPKKKVVKKKYAGAGKFRGEHKAPEPGSRLSEAQVRDAASVLAEKVADLSQTLGSFEPGGAGGVGFSDKQAKDLLEAFASLGNPQVEQLDQGYDDAGQGAERAIEFDEFSELLASGQIRQSTGGGPGTVSVSIDLRAPMQVLDSMLKNADVRDAKHVENALRLMAWEPDFFIYSELEEWRPTAKFEPHRMSGKLVKLARFWAELVRWVLIQVGSDQLFGVGWHFDYEFDPFTYERGYTKASYLREEGENWILLNPFVNGDPEKGKGEIYSLSNKDHLYDLFASAVHEVAHMVGSHRSHNDRFSATLTKYIAKTAGKWSEIEAIRRAVSTRPSKEQRDAQVAAKKAAALREKEARAANQPNAKRRDYVESYAEGGYIDGIVVTQAKTKQERATILLSNGQKVKRHDNDLTVIRRYDDVYLPEVGAKVVYRSSPDHPHGVFVVDEHDTEYRKDLAARDGYHLVKLWDGRANFRWATTDELVPAGQVEESESTDREPAPEARGEEDSSLPMRGETFFYEARPELFAEAATTLAHGPVTVGITRDAGGDLYLSSADMDHTGRVKAVTAVHVLPREVLELVQGRASGQRSRVHAHPGKFAQTLMRDASLGLRTVYCLVLEEVTDQLLRDGNRYFKVAFNKDLRLPPQIRMDRQLSEGMTDWQAACADQDQLDLYEELIQNNLLVEAKDLLDAMIEENMNLG